MGVKEHGQNGAGLILVGQGVRVVSGQRRSDGEALEYRHGLGKGRLLMEEKEEVIERGDEL